MTDWTEAVHSVEVLIRQVPWVVVSRIEGQAYHFPAPGATAHGEAVPTRGAENNDTKFRIVRITAVVPMYRFQYQR
ncbi:hypothetical protein [Haloarcula pelagica]|uniref:hypothetical protein n=1 Tax=Haloarcula pelagica TaxID=3033389 RepID=UPI0024C42052|nr:hypothetical protein [Halomicroarcula sp. YJ-61-S]